MEIYKKTSIYLAKNGYLQYALAVACILAFWWLIFWQATDSGQISKLFMYCVLAAVCLIMFQRIWNVVNNTDNLLVRRFPEFVYIMDEKVGHTLLYISFFAVLAFVPFARTISLPHSALFWIIPLGFSVGTFLGYSAIEGQSAKLVLSLCCLLVLATITMSRFVQMNLFIYLFVCSIVAGTIASILTHGFVFGGYIQPSELIKKS